MDKAKQLQALDPSLILHNEGHWDLLLDPNVPGYTSFNDAGIETETGEFLYAMARILKAKNVLETGTHIGVGMAYIGQALKDNHEGHLDTIEFLPELHQQAEERKKKLELNNYVTCHFGDVAKFEPKVTYDLIFLDTEPQTRFNELVKFEPFLKEGGYIFIHDLHKHMHQIPNEEHGFAWPFGPIPAAMQNLVKEGKLRPMHFPTPRGFSGFYKVSSTDYQWK